jgi:hypothetical protein
MGGGALDNNADHALAPGSVDDLFIDRDTRGRAELVLGRDALSENQPAIRKIVKPVRIGDTSRSGDKRPLTLAQGCDTIIAKTNAGGVL